MALLQCHTDCREHGRHHSLRRMNNSGFGLGAAFTPTSTTDHIVDDLLFATDEDDVIVTDEGFGIRTLDHSDF